ncbi:MAG: siphovirus Gp157 family protein [Clostridia bacterium]|nr:siphovirus Gp157 family protein [Clostridia bacterium]
MSNLYQLSNEVEKLYSDLMASVDEETGEINDTAITEMLAVKEAEFDNKAIAVATVQRRFVARANEIDEEIKRLTALKKRSDATAKRLENSLSMACQRLGKTKIDGISATISFRKSERVKLVDEINLTGIPDEFIKVEIKKSADKKAIKEALKAGEIIDGASLEEVSNIQIR